MKHNYTPTYAVGVGLAFHIVKTIWQGVFPTAGFALLPTAYSCTAQPIYFVGEVNRCSLERCQAHTPVKVGLDLEQIAIEGFLALTCLLGPSDKHIKSHQLLGTGKVVNLHKFKMAAVQSFNLQITFAPTAISPETVGRLSSLSARWIANSISYQAITLTITVQVSALRAAKVKK